MRKSYWAFMVLFSTSLWIWLRFQVIFQSPKAFRLVQGNLHIDSMSVFVAFLCLNDISLILTFISFVCYPAGRNTRDFRNYVYYMVLINGFYIRYVHQMYSSQRSFKSVYVKQFRMGFYHHDECNDGKVMKFVHELQTKWKCCGFINSDIWENKLPSSCCESIATNDTESGVVIPCTPERAYKQGCKEPFLVYINKIYWKFFLVALPLPEICGAIFTIWFFRTNNRGDASRNGAPAPTMPPIFPIFTAMKMERPTSATRPSSKTNRKIRQRLNPPQCSDSETYLNRISQNRREIY